jgi:hypothetical protein
VNCIRCKDEAWVCETHTDKPWNEKIDGGCECNAGMPCPDCNPCDRDNPPRDPPGFRPVLDVVDGFTPFVIAGTDKAKPPASE